MASFAFLAYIARGTGQMSYLIRIKKIEQRQQTEPKGPLSPDKPKECTSVQVESVTGLRPVYWEAVTGQILGPARVTHFMKAGAAFWLCVEYENGIRWIRGHLLRSRQAFAEQSRPEACQCCQTVRFWESIHGAVICGTCHPPAHSHLVFRWLNANQ